MKPSPLQLEALTYPVLSVRSVPDNGGQLSKGPLPIGVNATVLYDSDGRHFAYLSIGQDDEAYPYLVEIDVFTTFTIDVDGCRKAYKTAFNPQVVAVNIIRILYSSAREMLALLTSRGPHGSANLPSVMIEPSDVDMEFERDKLDVILTESFGIAPEVVRDMMEKFAQDQVLKPSDARPVSPVERPRPRLKKEPAASKKVPRNRSTKS